MHTIDQRVLASLSLKRDGVPIYVQIREQLLSAVASGLLGPGARMPTLRQVAVALQVDLNTVRHAYDDLREQGVIDLRRGQGSFVVDRPVFVSDPAPSDAPVAIDPLARRAIAEAREAGIDPLHLAAHIVGLIRSEELSS